MKNLYFISSNSYKINQLKKLSSADLLSLGYSIEVMEIPNLTEIQGTIDEVIIDKTLKAYDSLKKPCIVDDESFICEALNGFPGPYLKDFEASLLAGGIYNIISPLNNMKCYSCVKYGLTFNGNDVYTFDGKVEGRIIPPREGHESDKNYFEVISIDYNISNNKVNERLSVLEVDPYWEDPMRKEALLKLISFLQNTK